MNLIGNENISREEAILISLFCILYELNCLGTFENDSEYAFCPVGQENDPDTIIPKYYSEILDILEKYITIIEQKEK